MRKEIVSVLLAVTAALGCVTLLTSCGGAQLGGGATATNATLAYGKKYVVFESIAKDSGRRYILSFKKTARGRIRIFTSIQANTAVRIIIRKRIP